MILADLLRVKTIKLISFQLRFHGHAITRCQKNTKTILTIITICLVWIGINMTPSVLAKKQDVVDVNIVKVSDRFIGSSVPVVQK